ncbi:MAG: ribbon-helix-helix protein, CopG family [Burkholderiales bacterium]|nr:ribbon-helix-helix protein, CopG family [Burkholderiales bacterium]MDE2627408.1 ribbon-helix-helix protein, CopG family [Burkholderiales bacterium]
MEIKTARLTLLIDPNKKAAFEDLCARQDRNASQVVRQLIRDYLALHGVPYEAAGSVADDVEPAPAAAPRRPKPATKRGASPSARKAAGRRRA